MTTTEMTPDQIEIDIERTREDLRQNVDALKDKLSPTHAAKRSAARLGESVSQARDTLMGTAEDGVTKTQESMSDVSDKISRGTRGNPVAVGLGAFALGWLVSSLIPTTKTEQNAAGNLRDSDMAASLVQPITDTARTLAENVTDNARTAAENVADNAKEAAQDITHEAQTAAHTATENIGTNGTNVTSV
ncbi:MAG TPA: DUF3618 domain-containing protein [Dermatophilaceae bacterium]|nr:DUF3618 domain-containing protein [Dermatophilaceae bacterium]